MSRQFDGLLVEPLVLDSRCPLPEADSSRARKIPIHLLAIGDRSYTCEGPLDPHMPPVTWVRVDVEPLLIEELQAWASAKERRIEEDAEEKIRRVASRVTIVRVEGYAKLRDLRLALAEGAPFALGSSFRVDEAVSEAERLRRFLIALALPTMGSRHVARVMAEMANEDLAAHVDPPF